MQIEIILSQVAKYDMEANLNAAGQPLPWVADPTWVGPTFTCGELSHLPSGLVKIQTPDADYFYPAHAVNRIKVS